MGSAPLLDCAGRRRSPATFPGHHQGRPPRYKGLQYPPDPPTIEEIIAVMHVAGETPDGLRLRGLVVVLWRSDVCGLRGNRPPRAVTRHNANLGITWQGRQAPRSWDGPVGLGALFRCAGYADVLLKVRAYCGITGC